MPGFPAPFQTLVNKIAPLDFYRPIPEASIAPNIPLIPAATPTPRRRFSAPVQHRRQNHPLV